MTIPCPNCARNGHVGPQFTLEATGPEDRDQKGARIQKHLYLCCGHSEWYPVGRLTQCPACRNAFHEQAGAARVPCPKCAAQGVVNDLTEGEALGSDAFPSDPYRGCLAFHRVCAACGTAGLVPHVVQHQCPACRNAWQETFAYQPTAASNNITADDLLRSMHRI